MHLAGVDRHVAGRANRRHIGMTRDRAKLEVQTGAAVDTHLRALTAYSRSRWAKRLCFARW